MSKKDYELIAKALRDSNAPANVVSLMADRLQAAHPSGGYPFNRGLFLLKSTAPPQAAVPAGR